MTSRGKLLYDESIINLRIKHNKIEKRRIFCHCFFISIIIIIVLFMFSLSFFLFEWEENIVQFIITVILGVIAIGVAIFFDIDIILSALSIDDIKIYENGIVLPQKIGIPPKELFISYSDIQILFTNNKLPKMTILLKNQSPKNIFRSEIISKSRFIGEIEEKVQVIKDFQLDCSYAKKMYEEGKLKKYLTEYNIIINEFE